MGAMTTAGIMITIGVMTTIMMRALMCMCMDRKKDVNQMKNKIMIIVCSGLFFISALSFADDKQVTTSQATAGEQAKEKATFNHNQDIYNDKANKNIRAKKLVDKKLKSKVQDKKKVQDEQEKKNGLVEKNGQEEQNEQYDKRLTVKF